jgi:putative sterol carrier protein
MSDSVKELLEAMPAKFDPTAWGDSDAVIGFEVTGDEGGKWAARIEGGSLSIEDGIPDDTTMTITCEAADMIAMMKGELNGVSAFMQGKLKIDGDMSMAMKLQNLLG